MSRLLQSLFFICFITTLMGTQCYKAAPPPPQQEFHEKVALSPYQKKYNIGDTIWLHYQTNDKTFFDTLSNQRLSTSTLQYLFGAVLYPKYQAPDNPPGGYCTFITSAGAPLPQRTGASATTASFDIDCDAAPKYDVKLGVVLKYTGIYLLQLPGAIPLDACSGQANPYPRANLYFSYNLPDCNKDLYLSIPEDDRKEFPEGITEYGIDIKVSYAFEVN